jgi:hypothetical protein
MHKGAVHMEKWEELADFLRCYYNQDMDSIDEATNSFMDQNGVDYKNQIRKIIKEFVMTGAITNDQKESFITGNTAIYFPNLNDKPLRWLQKLGEKM